jgi:hypothetical protein
VEIMDIEQQDHATRPVHPALDLFGDTLCVTVQAPVSGAHQFVVLTSDGKLYRQDEWASACAGHNLTPIVAAAPRRCGSRWHGDSIRETLTALRAGEACPETWAEAYATIHAALDARLQLCDDRYLVLLTVYALMTYVHPLFDFLPILHLRGPAESGKSRAAHALAGLCFNGATFGCATDATLFRHAHEGRYTQIVTEADHLAALGPGHRFVRQLQSACSKAEATVDVAEAASTKSGTKAFVPATYATFCPRIFLSTQPFRSQPLRSRCIRLDLVKSPRANQEKLRASVTDDAVWAPLRDLLYRLLLHRWREVRDARDGVKAEWSGAGAPTGRTFDKWLPLATIAALVSAEVEATIRDLAGEDALEHQRTAADRQEAHIALFALWLVRDGRDQALSRKELYEAFLDGPPAKMDQDGAPAWARDTDAPVTIESLRRAVPNQAALVRELRRLGLTDDKKHTREGNRYDLAYGRVVEAACGIIGDDEVARIRSDLERAA